MCEHIVDGPLALARETVQSSLWQTCRKSGDGLWLFLELRQDLVDRERSSYTAIHVAWRDLL